MLHRLIALSLALAAGSAGAAVTSCRPSGDAPIAALSWDSWNQSARLVLPGGRSLPGRIVDSQELEGLGLAWTLSFPAPPDEGTRQPDAAGLVVEVRPTANGRHRLDRPGQPGGGFPVDVSCFTV